MTYCSCPFPIDYHGSDKQCGRCFRQREPEPNYCPDCKGEGFTTSPPIDITDPDYQSECDTCDGLGVVR